MTISGTYGFNPKVAEVLDEAWERIGRDPSDLTVRHIVSARRSLNLLLRSELSAEVNLWKVAEHIPTVPSQGDNNLVLPAGAIDVLEAVTRDTQGNDTPMEPIGRAEWLEIPTKTTEGRPDRWWVDWSTTPKTMWFWQAQSATPYTLVLNVLYGIQDVGDLANEADLPDLWYDVLCAGLARRLAVKWAPDRLVILAPEFQNARRLARAATIESGSVVMVADYGRR